MRLLEIGPRELKEIVDRQFAGLSSDGSDAVCAAAFNRLEFKRYLQDQLLRDTDVFSMAHSIEVRVPLLDHRIVEYAVGMPPALKIGKRINKPLLVHASNDSFVVKAGAAKKRGFAFP